MREVIRLNGIEVIDIDGIRYEYGNCGGIITVTKDGEVLGTISASDEEWELIIDGANPIEERWEDGIGNTLSYDGWGMIEENENI